ncbi:NAD(P)-binding protein [Leucogyrophana mollusca]|uniref:NAD(P)-binding protein n=1 Tax=Leucogyrophana mollusca TaxID=85980 RepID=A0ACB8BUX6_9AGAM|nr:NAD(P)-binding protein [Leucogyrophana mollusca]
MASAQPFVLRWGIISTGRIASCFVKDALVDPKTRDVHDVVHKITAVGSRSVAKADEFIAEFAGGDKSIKGYGSYTEVFADKNVDAVYIGTPHTFHYDNALEAIKAKKHVLCEKPVTCNGAELRSLLAAAKEHGVFFMEALWTRFQPLTKEVKKLAESGVLGDPVALQADLSGDFGINNLPKSHRILDPALGGGALLDLGPYPLIWAILALYEHPSNNGANPSDISGTMLKTPLTGVDRSTSYTVTFSPTSSSDKNTLSAQAIMSCNINAQAYQTGVIIRYERGTITIPAPIFCPKSFTVQYLNGKGTVAKEETRKFEYVGSGWHFQADEVARCVRDGKAESELWGHNKSLLEMDIFDEVRRQGGYKFPPGVEKVV